MLNELTGMNHNECCISRDNFVSKKMCNSFELRQSYHYYLGSKRKRVSCIRKVNLLEYNIILLIRNCNEVISVVSEIYLNKKQCSIKSI